MHIGEDNSNQGSSQVLQKTVNAKYPEYESLLLCIQLDTDEVTVENSMSKSFDQIIKLQLDPIWNQLVSDCVHIG